MYFIIFIFMFIDTKTSFGLHVILNAMYLFIDNNSRPISVMAMTRSGSDSLVLILASGSSMNLLDSQLRDVVHGTHEVADEGKRNYV